MTITAEIITDSVNPDGNRLTTFVLRYPRFIHAELNTHRALSRNASSSRAIPVKKIIQQVKDDPAMPVFWGKSESGMQAREELTGHELELAQRNWLWARDKAVDYAETLLELGLHKQTANRILEPWAHITVIASATEWANFFSLRCHPDAQPEFQALAYKMADLYKANKPKLLRWGDWHLPFIKPGEFKSVVDPYLLIKCSVARCARVSYLNHDGSEADIAKDLQLYERLVGQVPRHASPAEHPAKAVPHSSNYDFGNYKGFLQLRKTLQHENITTFPWESKN